MIFNQLSSEKNLFCWWNLKRDVDFFSHFRQFVEVKNNFLENLRVQLNKKLDQKLDLLKMFQKFATEKGSQGSGSFSFSAKSSSGSAANSNTTKNGNDDLAFDFDKSDGDSGFSYSTDEVSDSSLGDNSPNDTEAIDTTEKPLE